MKHILQTIADALDFRRRRYVRSPSPREQRSPEIAAAYMREAEAKRERRRQRNLKIRDQSNG